MLEEPMQQQQHQQSQHQLQGTSPELQQLAEANQAIQRQLAAAQAELKAQQAKRATEAAFEVTLEGCTETLIDASALDGEEQLRAAAHLYVFFEKWAATGGAVPFTLDELKAPNLCQVPVVFQKLLGASWERWVAQGGGLTSSILPRQLAWMARCALVRLHKDLVLIAETRTAAENSFALAETNAKKRRAAM